MGGKSKKKTIRTWQMFLIFVLMVFVSATLLRLDHIKMTRLRDAVIAADDSGDEEELANALNALKSFVTHNIVVNVVDDNGARRLEFGTGVFYLEKSYQRDATAVMEAAAEAEIDDSNPHGNIYAAVAAICKPRAIANGWNWTNPGYLNCFTEELAKYPADAISSGEVAVAIPSTELYRHDYVSPVWAPTLTGFTILVTLALFVVIFIRVLIWGVLEITLIILKKY